MTPKDQKKIAFIDCYIHTPSRECFELIKANFPYYEFSCFFPAHAPMESLEEFDAIIAIGSSSMVTDQFKWQLDLAEILHRALLSGIPVLATCFSFQLLCHKFDCGIGEWPADKKRIGAQKVNFLDTRFPSDSTFAYQHRQWVRSLSDQLMVIGHSRVCEIEAVEHRTLPFWGFQGHLESSMEFCANEAEIADPFLAKKCLDNGQKIIKTFFRNFMT